MKAICNLGLLVIFILQTYLSYSQTEYMIAVSPNLNPKQNLSILTKNIQFSSRHIVDSVFRIKSLEDYNLQDFEAIAAQEDFEIISFEKSIRPIDNNNFDNFEKACCTIDLEMFDSYGDGWNGGYLTVTIDGSSSNYAASGSSSSVSIAYCDGQVLEIEYTAGGWFSYENENSYTISTTAGTLISDGPSPNTGEVFYSNNACSSTSETVKSQDCEGSTLVCSNASFSGNSDGAGDFNDLNSFNDGCLYGENQSSWYYINVGTSGTLAMDIVPSNGSDDYDFAIWGPFTSSTAGANCPPITSPLRCNYVAYPRSWGCGTNTNPTGLAIDNSLPISNDDCTNNSHVRHINATAGDIYILVIDNYSESSQPFQLNWNGTAGLDCTTVPLPVELISFTGKNQGDQNIISWNTLSEKNIYSSFYTGNIIYLYCCSNYPDIQYFRYVCGAM
jgi:hypothetical protein